VKGDGTLLNNLICNSGDTILIKGDVGSETIYLFSNLAQGARLRARGKTNEKARGDVVSYVA
jgi:hypothetical protein